jgi:hypothetical protein
LSAADIRQLITHFTNTANFAGVLDAAHDAGAQPEFIVEFLRACRTRNWQQLAKIQAYFLDMKNGRATAQDFTNSLAWANDFYTAHNTATKGGAKTDYDGGNTLNLHVERTFNFNRTVHPNTPCDVVITTSDLLHWKCGHTFEEFSLTRGNAGRAQVSSLWPRNTADNAILNDAAAVVGTLRPGIQAGVNTNENRIALNAPQGQYTYFVGINAVAASAGAQYRMVQFYPTAGGESIPRHVLRALVELF